MVSIKTEMFTRVGDYPGLLSKWDFERNPQKDIARIRRINVYSPGVVHWHCKKHQHHWPATILEVIEGKDCEHCYRELLPKGFRVVTGGLARSRNASEKESVEVEAKESKKKRKSLLEAFPEVAAEWHPTKNDDLTPDQVARFSNKTVWWQCNENPDHEWKAMIKNRTRRKSGCPTCRNRRKGNSPVKGKATAPKEKSNTVKLSEFPHLLKEWNFERNTVNPYQINRSSAEHYWWTCKRNHHWQASVLNRVYNGNCCPTCRKQKRQRKKQRINKMAQKVVANNLTMTHPEVASQWHPTKNGKLRPENVTYGSGLEVWWRCDDKNGHEWKSRIYNRTAGSGCRQCYAEKMKKSSSIN